MSWHEQIERRRLARNAVRKARARAEREALRAGWSDVSGEWLAADAASGEALFAPLGARERAAT